MDSVTETRNFSGDETKMQQISFVFCLRLIQLYVQEHWKHQRSVFWTHKSLVTGQISSQVMSQLMSQDREVTSQVSSQVMSHESSHVTSLDRLDLSVESTHKSEISSISMPFNNGAITS